MAAGAPVTGGDELMTIGEFSRRCRLPVSTLRYYHHRGLLRPVHVDPATGYRSYSRAQLIAASLVGELRRAGVRPAVIDQITNGDVDAAIALDHERQRIETEMHDRVASLSTIDRIMSQLASHARNYTITTEHRTEQTVPAVCGAVDSESATMGIQRLIIQLRKSLRKIGADQTGPSGALFSLDIGVDPTPVTVFAVVPLTAQGTVRTTQLPPGHFATSEHEGDHQLGPAYAALLDQISDSGAQPTGPVIEEYLGKRNTPRTRIAIGVAP